jgi:hypothetical protein
MKMLKMCLNPKVLAGLAATGVAMYLIAPNLLATALPVLLLAACPLSMLIMMLTMKDMQGHHGEARERQLSQEENDTGLTREEQIARLRAQQAALGDRIGRLEWEKTRPAAKEGRW